MATIPSDKHLSYQAQIRKCARTCTCNGGQGHGPYLYAYWREGTRMKSGNTGMRVEHLRAYFFQVHRRELLPTENRDERWEAFKMSILKDQVDDKVLSREMRKALFVACKKHFDEQKSTKATRTKTQSQQCLLAG